MRSAAAALCLLLPAGCGGGDRGPVPPGPLGLAAEVTPDRVKLGEPARLVVRLRRDGGVAAAFPDVAALLGGDPDLVVEAGPAAARRLAGGGEAEVREYTIRRFKVGKAELPALRVQGARAGEELAAAAPALALEVLSDLAGRGEAIEAPAGPLPLPGPARWPWWAAGAGAAALLAAAAFLVLRRGRRPAPPPPLPPAHLAALAALAEIRQRRRDTAEAVTALAVECSGVVRRYVEDAFGLLAPERTSEEFLAEAAERGAFPGERRSLLQGFLEECDRAKFARWFPPPDRQEGILGAAERFVRLTAPGGEEGP